MAVLELLEAKVKDEIIEAPNSERKCLWRLSS